MNIEYDKVADALYIRLAYGEVSKTIELSEKVMADLDASGTTIGLEVLDISAHIRTIPEPARNISVL